LAQLGETTTLCEDNQKKKEIKHDDAAIYCAGDSLEQLGEKYFDYNGVSPDCSDNPEKNTLTTSSSTASTTACHARGLDIAHSRNLSATLGGSISTRFRVRKITLKTCDFVDISNKAIPTTLMGSTTTSPPIVVVILRQQLAYLYIIDYDHADDSAPDKS
jgi:hypothetical protein